MLNDGRTATITGKGTKCEVLELHRTDFYQVHNMQIYNTKIYCNTIQYNMI
jgi:hypothetical protein